MEKQYFNVINDVHVSTNCSYKGNFSEQLSRHDEDWMYAVKLMRNICIPLITMVGLVGNTLSLLVHSASCKNTSSWSVFLAALAIADNVFLLCLLVTWIDGDWYVLIRHDITCQLLVFTTYVAKFLSVWFIVGFSLERFIAICVPLKNRYLCSVFRKKVLVFIMTVAACVLYSFSVLTTGMQFQGSNILCSHSIEMFQFLEIATWVDTVLTTVMPFVVIVIVNTKILYTVLICHQRLHVHRKHVNKKNKLGSSSSGPISSPKLTSYTRSRTRHKLRLKWTLLLVSTSILLLYLPSYIIRIYNLIRSITHQNDQRDSFKFFFLQELTLVLYYLTFSCNFIVYTVFGKNFMSSFRAIFRCKTTRQFHGNSKRYVFKEPGVQIGI